MDILKICDKEFGGKWTKEKLQLLAEYLKAYTKIMAKQNFKFAYIDAFAGTGYFKKTNYTQASLLFPEFGVQEKGFLDGSARIALCVEPSFDKFIFIEKDEQRFIELEKLKEEFPHRKEDIIFEKADANKYLKNICKKNWKYNRAVVFLDPYGMQVEWDTIKSIAQTQAIDLWILFPLGQAVNRLLKTNGNIDENVMNKLDNIFGTTDWYNSFYREEIQYSLLNGETKRLQKIANFEIISSYFLNRLETIFAGVSSVPRPLFNSKNNPLFLLCFAAGNPRGAPIAIKIADHILKTI